MEPQTERPDVQTWRRLVGTWATEATHRLLPDGAISGHASFEWLEDQQFLIQRTHYDHPQLPDALMVIGLVDGEPTNHYFDSRGVHRVFHVDFTGDTWRFWNEVPGFSQRFTGTLGDGDTRIDVDVELRTEDTWEHDLAMTYRRTG
jgi:hypothetical protein